jgi:hypothetical protein
MPLITCPDCGKQVSDRAPACPNCGCPISSLGDLSTVKIMLNRDYPHEMFVMDCSSYKILGSGRYRQTVSFSIDKPTSIIIGASEIKNNPNKYVNKDSRIHKDLFPHLRIEPGKKYEYYEVIYGTLGNHYTFALREIEVNI